MSVTDLPDRLEKRPFESGLDPWVWDSIPVEVKKAMAKMADERFEAAEEIKRLRNLITEHAKDSYKVERKYENRIKALRQTLLKAKERCHDHDGCSVHMFCGDALERDWEAASD